MLIKHIRTFKNMQLKKYHNGTHRVSSLTDTLDKITPFLKDMGITRVANVTGLDSIGLPVITVCRPNSKSLAVSQGKGHCLDAAKVSGIMESIEGFHAENIDLNVVKDTYNNLKTRQENVIQIDGLARNCEYNFDGDDLIDWVKCQSLVVDKPVWTPYEIITASFLIPEEKGRGFFIADSNGLASGNTIGEAINHALFEVIERDCLALWQLTPIDLQHKRRVNPQTINDPFLERLIDKFTTQNILMGVWDITNDLNIPTFICKIVSKENTGVRPAFGIGTHLDKSIALSRAMTEAAQSRLTFISGARDDQYDDHYEDEISNKVYESWVDELTLPKDAKLKSYEDIVSISHDYIEEDQEFMINQLHRAGLKEIVYADLTKPQFDIPVVKVVVPGLEGITYPDRRVLGERAMKYYRKYGVGACEVT